MSTNVALGGKVVPPLLADNRSDGYIHAELDSIIFELTDVPCTTCEVVDNGTKHSATEALL